MRSVHQIHSDSSTQPLHLVHTDVCGPIVKNLLLINRPNQVKIKKIDWIEEPVPPDHPRAMI